MKPKPPKEPIEVWVVENRGAQLGYFHSEPDANTYAASYVKLVKCLTYPEPKMQISLQPLELAARREREQVKNL